MTLQEAWNAGSLRRQAFAFSAATPGMHNWVPCESTGDASCPVGGYRYYGGVGPATYGDPDLTPELAIFHRDILAGIIVLNQDPNHPDTWLVKATGQAVGFINGVIVLPGQAPPTPPPPPATNQPISGADLSGIMGIHAVAPTPGTSSAPAPSAPDLRVDEILARVRALTPWYH